MSIIRNLSFLASNIDSTGNLAGEKYSTNATVSAAGNIQGTGTALTHGYNVITTVAASSGVVLPTATVGRRIIIVNKGANPLSVYPATGATVDAIAANGLISIPINGWMEFNASSTTQWYSTYNITSVGGGGGGVTSVGFTGGLLSVATATTTPAITVAGTSGGIPYFSSGTTWASSAALAASALVIGGGAGVAPSTTTTGTGVITALGIAVGTAGSVVVNGGALGTPSGGTLTNCTFPTVPKSTNLVGGNATTLLGSIPYQSGTDTTTQLAPNITATKMFLRETGNGTNGAAPAWDTIVIGDLPTITPTKGGTGVAQASAASTLTISGAFGTTLTVSATTALTLPTSGTLLTTTGTAASATNIAGGVTGGVPYQTGNGATSITAASTAAGQVLTTVTLGGAPTWVTPAAGGGATSTYTRTSFTATAEQTSFSVAYTVGFVEVFLNGVLLNSTDYTASNGTTIVLNLAATIEDIIETIAYNVSVISSTVTSITAGTGLTGGTITSSGTINLGNTTVTAGSYTNANITIDAQGRISTATNGTSASPAGTTGQVQYNNTGAFAGAANVTIQNGHLTLVDTGTIPTAPATGTLTFFAEEHAGKMFPSVIGPSGIDYNLQAALYGNTTYMWLAGGGTTAAISWGTVFQPRNVGNGFQAHPTKASTSSITSMNRATFTSESGSSNTGAGIHSSSTVAWLGNAAGLGGFLFFARFGVETLVSTCKVLVGLSALSVALPTGSQPSANINTIALCKDSTDTTWQIITRNASTGTKINTSITITVGQIIDLFIHSAPNSQSVKFHIKDGVTGADLYVGTAITTPLPVNSVFMNMHTHIQSTTTATVSLALNRMYVETDL